MSNRGKRRCSSAAVAEVKRLLDQGLSANVATTSGGVTALMAAAPDVDKMRLLLDRGARVALADGEEASVFNAHPFFIASYAGNAAILKRLAQAGANTKPAHAAARFVARDAYARRLQVR